MRKFSKILTVLLTVCLLAGVVTATVVSAADETTSEYTVKKKSTSASYTLNSGQKAYVRAGVTVNGVKDSYYRLYRDSASVESYPTITSTKVPTFSLDSTTTFNSQKYIVIDLDFTSDRYLDANGELNETSGTKLAYATGISFYHYRVSGHKCYIVENNGLWYAADAATYADAEIKIPLATEAGVWNHLTYVIDGINGLSYCFIDGQFLSSYTEVVTTNANNSFYVNPNSVSSQFSVAFENLEVRNYPTNYADGDNIKGNSIADYFIGSETNTSVPIYNCDDMAYNSDYTFTYILSSEGQVVASIGEDKYNVLAGALKALKSKSGEVTLETKKSIVDFEIPEAIDTLTVVCTKGATFSYTGSYATTSETVEGDTTTYVIKKARFVDATWKGVDGETTIATEQVAVIIENNAVYIPDEIAEIYTIIKGIGRYEWALNDGGYEPFVPGTPLPDGVAKITVRPVTAMVTWQGDAEDVDETWFIGSDLQINEGMYSNIKGTENYEWSCDDGVTYTEFIIGTAMPDGVTKIIVRPVTATVIWKGIEGISDNDVVETWFIGSTLEAGDLTRFSSYEENDGNGWYVIKYVKWDDSFVENETTVVGNVEYVPVKGLVASLTDIKLNMSLLTKFEANLFISEAPQNVTLNALYTKYDDVDGYVDNVFEALKNVELDGKSYLLDNFFFDNSDVDKVISRYVEYEVEYEGQTTTLVAEVKVSLLDYAEKVLAQYGCGSEEANLAYNLINYANAAYALKTGTDYEDAIAFLALEGHEDGCACNATYNYAGEEVYYDFFYEEYVLGENVYAVSFDVSNEQPAFVVYVMLDEFGNALADVKVEFNGIFGTDVGDVAFNLVRGDDITIEGVGTFATLFFEDMPLYNATEIFTITATDATTGEVYVCNYSLATYIDYFSMMGVDADDRGLAVAEALYSFAKVAKDYKLN